jgi:Lon protease-like protein
MKIPREVPVMILPGATLFPHELLPLRIFEPRYRQMLDDSLGSHRMFSVALRKPGVTRETPLSVAGLGFIRVSTQHADGTSHLVLQGLARVKLEETVQYKPYRVQRIRALTTPPCDNVKVDALLLRVRELTAEWCDLLWRCCESEAPPLVKLARVTKVDDDPKFSPKALMNYLESLPTAAQVADAVSWAMLPGAAERQVILETVDVETRLRKLIRFLMAQIQSSQGPDTNSDNNSNSDPNSNNE